MTTVVDMAARYSLAYPARPPLQLVFEDNRAAVYGVFVIGNDYRNKTQFYGGYPPSYLDRIHVMFGVGVDMFGGDPVRILHVFSGSLPPGPYDRCDLVQPAEFQCSVYDLPTLANGRMWDLAIADPPYSKADAKKYGTPPVNGRLAMKALAQVVPSGGYTVWLDTQWPMHSKQQWLTVGRILVQRSTMHRVRVCTIFQRT